VRGALSFDLSTAAENRDVQLLVLQALVNVMELYAVNEMQKWK
jgi:hypothetical protein